MWEGICVNILYIEHYAGSPEMGMEFRPYYLSREWVKMGYKVTIIAGDYSHLRKKNPTVSKDFQTDMIDGIEYVWLKTGIYEGNGVKRALTMERFVRKLLTHSKMIAKKWSPNVVIASSTYPLDTYPAQRISKLAKAKYIHEFHDLWPATLYEIGGMSKKHPFVIAMQFAENSACKRCDSCVALAPYTKNYFVEHGLDPKKFSNIQNGIDLKEWESFEEIPQVHKEYFDQHRGKFIVGYFGGHALSNALDWALDIVKEFKDNHEIEFVFVGDGIEKKRLKERKVKEQINNVHFLPPVAKKAVPSLLRYFDCSYMTGMPSPLYRFGLCLNKMYDSMMAGIPIICAFDAPDTLVKQYKCGFQCNPLNKNEIVEAINELYHMSLDQRKELGNRGKQAVMNHFTYEKLANDFVRIMEEKG